ncbi:MAG: hypothetical protein OEN56_02725 [Gemmatimonadota bacterium]|nr:hypothetical protein [Gemmatimonadota bacterium]
MKLAETNYDNRETGCCARLDVEAWDETEHVWDRKPFVKDRVRKLFHVPLNFGTVVERDHQKIEAVEGYPREPFTLADERSRWSTDLYFTTDREIPDATMEHLSGTFVSKVFEGPYGDAGKWMEAMKAWVRARGQEPEHIYFYYATCPKCAKQFGKNHVVLFAKVA